MGDLQEEVDPTSVAETVLHYAGAEPRNPVAVAISLEGLTDEMLIKLKSQVDHAATKRNLLK
jgi:hypothetical protein